METISTWFSTFNKRKELADKALLYFRILNIDHHLGVITCFSTIITYTSDEFL